MSLATEVKENRLYTKDHEWASVAGKEVTIGITAFAVDQLGDITLIGLDVKVGDKVVAGKTFGTIESVKTLSDLFAPVSGTIKKLNAALDNSPELINDDCWEQGWMVVIEADNLEAEKAAMLSAADYAKFLQESAH